MISPQELKALVFLLDDSDEEVLQHVEQKLLDEGTAILHELEAVWEQEGDPAISRKLEDIIRRIQTSEIVEGLRVWHTEGRTDLLEVCMLLSRIQYPDVSVHETKIQLEKLRLDAWLEFHYDLSPLEKVNILNHVFFQLHGYKGNTNDYHAPDNSFLHKVLETKTGNPITLACIYAIVAQRLNMPVFGVNLPQHFVLVYMDDADLENPEYFGDQHSLDPADFKRVLFYINPFNQGQIFGKRNIDEFLEELKLPARVEYYIPCQPIDMIRRMLRNLLHAYTRLKRDDKTDLIRRAMQAVGMNDELDDERLEPPEGNL